MRRVVATGLGSGYAPIAPGTFGSMVGLALGWLASSLGGTWSLAGATLAVIALGWWSAGPVARELRSSDPGPIVIDEIAGQLIALWWIRPDWPALLAAFFAFRLFDIVKPFPARRAERLPGASGIMTDDLIAGVYANLALQLLQRGFGAL